MICHYDRSSRLLGGVTIRVLLAGSQNGCPFFAWF